MNYFKKNLKEDNECKGLDDSDILDKIHRDALRVLEETGVKCASPVVRKIFEDTKDCKEFLGRLGDILSGTETTCYAWAIIPNHFLCEASHNDIST